MRRLLVPAIALLALVAGCSAKTEPPPSESADLRRILVDLVRDQDPGDRIRLRDAWPGDWDRAAFFGPYTDDDRAKTVLGFDFPYEAVSPWVNTEGGWVVVLAKGDEALAWLKVSATEIGLYCVPELVKRDADEFTVGREDGYAFIGAEGQADHCI
jgi:hypothetical protein